MIERIFRTVVLTLVVGVALAVTAPRAAYACPFCADQVEQKSADDRTISPSSAYNYSIFAMIGIFFTVLAGMGRLAYVVVKQADAEALARMPVDAPATAIAAGDATADSSSPATTA